MKKYFNFGTILLFCIVLAGSVSIAFVPTTEFVLWYGTVTVTYFALHVLQTSYIEMCNNNNIHDLYDRINRQLDVMYKLQEVLQHYNSSLNHITYDLNEIQRVVEKIESQTKPKTSTPRKKKETPKS